MRTLGRIGSMGAAIAPDARAWPKTSLLPLPVCPFGWLAATWAEDAIC
jgi:hypothetical protein